MSKKIKIIDLVQDDKNFNKHTQYGMSLLEKSIEKVGVIESVTISADDKVISGNARQEIMALKFENTEPIIIETDETRPVILKRTDIKSNTKQFHEAALLANTVSKKNWTDFLNKSISIMRKNNKPFYIKNDLAEWANEETQLFPHERDMDYLALKNNFELALL